MAHAPPTQRAPLTHDAADVGAGSPCGRCGRAAEYLESWLERRRLRAPSTDPGGYRYGHRIVEHLVCPACYEAVRAGKPPVVNRGIRVMVLVVLTASLLAAALPFAMPSLMAAFWQNGAAPAGWREHRVGGHPDFLQGRF